MHSRPGASGNHALRGLPHLITNLSSNMGTLLAEPGGLGGPRVGGELAFSLDEPAFSSDHFR